MDDFLPQHNLQEMSITPNDSGGMKFKFELDTISEFEKFEFSIPNGKYSFEVIVKHNG